MFRDHSLTTNSHRTLMALGVLSALGLVFALFLGWFHFFQERARREALIKAAMTGTQRASLMAAQRAADSESIAGIVSGSSDAGKVTVNDIGKDEGHAAPLAMIRLAEPPHPSQVNAAKAVLDKFGRAASWAEKLPHVHDSARVRPLLQSYYETQGRNDPVLGALAHSDRYRTGGQELLVLTWADAQPGSEVNAVMVRESDGRYSLDWESYVGWGEVPLADFKKERPASPKFLRVRAKLDDTYKGEFSDPASYVVFELQSPDGQSTLHGFSEKRSPVARALVHATADGGACKVALTLQFPADGKSSESVRITAVVAEGWLVLR